MQSRGGSKSKGPFQVGVHEFLTELTCPILRLYPEGFDDRGISSEKKNSFHCVSARQLKLGF